MIECPICRKFTFCPSANYASHLTEDTRALEFVDLFGNMMESDDEEGLEQEEGGGPNPPALNEVVVEVAAEIAALEQQEDYFVLDILSPEANQVDGTEHSSDTSLTEQENAAGPAGPRGSNSAPRSLVEEAETSAAPRNQSMNDENEAGPSGYRRPNPARTSAARIDPPTPRGRTPGYPPAPSRRMRADHEEAGPSGYVAPRQNPAPRDVGGGGLDPFEFVFRRTNPAPRNVDGGEDRGAPGFEHLRPNPSPGSPRSGNRGFNSVPSYQRRNGQEPDPSRYDRRLSNPARPNAAGSGPATPRNNNASFSESVASEVASRMGSRRTSNSKG